MNQSFPDPSPTQNDVSVAAAVGRLAAVMIDLSVADLGQPWAWGPHAEGVRFALLGSYQELRELAVRLGSERQVTSPMSAPQHALAQYHAAYRDLMAVLLGVDDDLAGRAPAPGEWPVRETLYHILRAERGFYTLLHYGLRRQRDAGDLPERLPEGEVNRVLGEAEVLQDGAANAGLHELIAYYEALHGRALREFAGMTAEESRGPSLWWEDIRFPLQHRLHRLDAHLRQHTVQIENTLAALGQEPQEAKRLLRLVFNALAEVEGLLIGAPDAALDDRRALAGKLVQRAAEIADLVEQTHRLQTAVRQGDLQTAGAILSTYPALVDAHDQQRLPLILSALYNRQPHAAALFEARGTELSIFEAAALGKVEVVRSEGEAYPEDITAYSRDGFTALQLACYFGREAAARWLVANGADVNAVSRNDQALQAVHAAAANNSAALCRLLLEQGADANARQAGGYTPLHAAAQNGNSDLAILLLESGANPAAVSDRGETAVELAQAAGHAGLAARLSENIKQQE